MTNEKLTAPLPQLEEGILLIAASSCRIMDSDLDPSQAALCLARFVFGVLNVTHTSPSQHLHVVHNPHSHYSKG